MEVITSKPLQPSNLAYHIQPFLRQEQWDNGKLYRVRLSHDKYFDAHDPDVWKVLEPILVLASRILADSLMTPFLSPCEDGSRCDE